MKYLKLKLLMLIIVAGNFAFSQGTWNYVNNSGTSFILYGMSFPAGQSNIGYACGMQYTYNADGVIVKTTDGGENWTQILPVSGDINGLQSIWFTDENTGFAVGWNNYFIKTTDGGASWTNVSAGSNVWYYTDIQFWDENNGVASAYQNGSDPGVYVTEDGGDTWTAATSGINTNIWAVDYAGENIVYAININGYLYKSTDGGYNWTQLSPPGAMLMGIDFVTEDFGVMGAEERIYATTDGGTTWTEFVTGYENFYATKCFEDGTAYVGGTDENIYVTYDYGNSWTMEFNGAGTSSLYRIRTTENGTAFTCGSQGNIMYKEPVLTADFVADITELCQGGDVNFSDLSTGTPTTWNWTFEGGTPETSSLQNPVVTYNTAGVFDVELEISDGTNTVNHLISDYISVNPLPGIPGTPEGPEEVCNNESDLYLTSGSSDADTLIWILDPVEAGTIVPSGEEVTVSWSESFSGMALLSCYGINDCGEGYSSDDFEISVNSIPDPEIEGPDLVCSGYEYDYQTENNAGSSYLWNVDGGEIVAGAGTHLITVLWGDPGLGYVNVTETTEYGCVQQTDNFDVTIDDCTGLEELEVIFELSLTITNYKAIISGNSPINEVTVFDITGKVMHKQTIAGSKEVTLNIRNYSPGLYIVTVKGINDAKTLKLLKN